MAAATVVGRSDRCRQRQVSRLVRITAVVGEKADRVELETMPPPLPTPALQQRALRIHQQAVEVKDQRLDRHSDQYPGCVRPTRRPSPASCADPPGSGAVPPNEPAAPTETSHPVPPSAAGCG